MREEITIQQILGKKPDAPYRWIVFNAPRPIKGDLYWEGEFVTGRFYVAVNPAGYMAKWCVQQNANLDAVICEYIEPQSIDTWAREEFGEDYDEADKNWHRQAYMGQFGSRTVPLTDIFAICVLSCDLCGDGCGDRTTIGARDMAYAAEHGFCPVEQGLISSNCQNDLQDLASAGISFAKVWHDDAICEPSSCSDWNVCNDCLVRLLSYLPTVQEQEA